MPYQTGPMQCRSSRAEPPSLLFGSWVHVAWSIPDGPPLDIWPLSSPTGSGGVVLGTGYSTLVVWLLVELVVSRLLGRNRWPTVPRVQDPGKTCSWKS
jgi:hypothetical protein